MVFNLGSLSYCSTSGGHQDDKADWGSHERIGDCKARCLNHLVSAFLVWCYQQWCMPAFPKLLFSGLATVLMLAGNNGRCSLTHPEDTKLGFM